MSVSFETGPQVAYDLAGAPRGRLRRCGEIRCKCCGGQLVAYSIDGARETAISSLCEPCFDFVAVPADERDAIDAAWMRRVTIRREDDERGE